MGGTGVPGSTAAKLLRRYGTLAGAVEAAAQGELRGWPPEVQELLASPEQVAELQRRHTLFTLQADASTLPEAARTQLGEALARLPRVDAAPAASSTGEAAAGGEQLWVPLDAAALAWEHPLNAGRWRWVQPCAEQLSTALSALGRRHTVRATLAGGLTTDVLVPSDEFQPQTVAVLVVTPADFNVRAPLEMLQRDLPSSGPDLAASGLDDYDRRARFNKQLSGHLSGAARHQFGLLRKCGVQPACVPWWHLEPLPAE